MMVFGPIQSKGKLAALFLSGKSCILLLLAAINELLLFLSPWIFF
jgi:hypothetical protein